MRVEIWDVSESEHLLVMHMEDKRPLPELAFVSVSSYELGHAYAEFRPGVDVLVTIALAKPASIRLVIKDLPPELKYVDVFYSRGPDFSSPRTLHLNLSKATAMGDDSLPRFQPGRYRFDIRPPGHSPWPILQQEVELISGEQTVELKAPPLYNVKIDASGISIAPFVNIVQTASRLSRHCRLSDTNTAILNHLPAGEYTAKYRLSGNSMEEKSLKFVVPGQETIVLTE
jgi:hypothetical protein